METILSNILAAVALVGIFAGVLVEAIKRTEVFSTRTLPIISLVIGMLAGLALAFGFHQDVPTFVSAGFIGGAVASGLYDGAKSFWDIVRNFIDTKGE